MTLVPGDMTSGEMTFGRLERLLSGDNLYYYMTSSLEVNSKVLIGSYLVRINCYMDHFLKR